MREPDSNPIIVDRSKETYELIDDFTLRDLFAAAAMAGQEACPDDDRAAEEIARIAYMTADAMLAERAKP